MEKSNFIKTFFIVLFCLFTILIKAQVASVEKSINSIQVGLLSVLINNEIKLTNELSLKSEIGMTAGIFGGTFYPKTGYLIVPAISVEPRWYYNLQKRLSKNKIIANNNGNYLTIQTSFNPNWFNISNYNNIKIVNQLTIIPTWGLRRNLNDNLNYEIGFGLGYKYYFAKSAGYIKNESSAAANLHLRIGYNF